MKPSTVEKRVKRAMAQDKPMNPTFLKWYTGASERQLTKFFKGAREEIDNATDRQDVSTE